MKLIIQRALFVALTFFASNSYGQLANGTLLPTGINLTDINGNSYNIDALISGGKTIFIDVSATWSGPCWGFHQTHILDDLYTQYGPQGTDEVRVFWIEGDATTSVDLISGIGANTQGDWTAGTSFPLCDNADAATTLQIGFYPTLYMICPTRRVWHISPSEVLAYWPVSQHIDNARDCSNPIDAVLDSYTGETSTCGTLSPLKVNIQNKGVQPLTAANITASIGGTQVATINWTGALEQFQESAVSFGSANITSISDLTFTVTPAGTEATPSDNSLVQTINLAPIVTSANIIVKVTTDQYGTESSWKIRRSNNTVVASGGPYTDLAAAGTTVQPNVSVTLPSNDCYSFEMSDAYGDGMCCLYGQGGYEVTTSTGIVILSGGEFVTIDKKRINYNYTAPLLLGNLTSNGISNNNPNPITFSINPTGCSSFTYQWYSLQGVVSAPTGSSTSGWALIPGATSNTYDPPTISNSTSFACFVTPLSSCGNAAWAGGVASFSINTSQINVTFNVDITDYLASGNTLGPNGIRIGGNFATNSVTLPNGTPMVDWTPSDATSAMTNIAGTNIWTITVSYATLPFPSADIVQSYKFVNNDWGTNEGTDPSSQIAIGGCGDNDGGGNINRILTISDFTADIVLSYCWDKCTSCSNYGIISSSGINNQNNPNPISFSSNPAGCSSFTYQWYSTSGIVSAPTGSSTSGWSLIPGATLNSYDPPTLYSSTSYACFITPEVSCGNAGWAEGVASFSITTSSGSVNGQQVEQCAPSSVPLSFTSQPVGLGNSAFQWYFINGSAACPQGNATSGWTAIAGATSSTSSFVLPSFGTFTLACLVTPEGITGLPSQWANGCKTVVVNSFTAQTINGNQNISPFTSYTYLVNQTAGHTYSWTAFGGAVSSGQNTNQVSVIWAATGSYQLMLIESNGVCSDTSYLDVENSTITQINETEHTLSNVQVFPNPTDVGFIIQSNAIMAGESIELLDQVGRLVLQTNAAVNSTYVSIAHLAKGIYFLRLPKHPEYSRKLIVN
jgi:hypothetical protein